MSGSQGLRPNAWSKPVSPAEAVGGDSFDDEPIAVRPPKRVAPIVTDVAVTSLDDEPSPVVTNTATEPGSAEAAYPTPVAATVTRSAAREKKPASSPKRGAAATPKRAKSAVARPPVAARISVYLSSAQYAQFRDRAQELGMHTNEFIVVTCRSERESLIADALVRGGGAADRVRRRPKVGDPRPVNMSFSIAELDAIDELAASTGRTRSNLIAEVIDRVLSPSS